MALLTGGDEIGFQRAIELLDRFGAAPGTHTSADGCGYANLWISGRLESARYPYQLDGVDRGGLNWGDWFMADLGISDEVRFFKIAEVVEKLRPDAAKLEIIVP